MTQPVNSFPSTQVARAAAGLYDLQLGQTTMQSALGAATVLGSVAALADQVFIADFAGLTNAQVAALVVGNVGITVDSGLTAAQVADAVTYVVNALAAAAPGAKGSAVLTVLNMFAQLGDDVTYGGAATAFNAQITAATGYASTPGTVDIPVTPPPDTTFLTIAQETVAGLDSMRLAGNQAIRLDFGNTLHQIRGLDLNGDGTIAADGEENNFAYLEANVKAVGDNHSGFEVIDAYARNPLNISDSANNFLAPIYYDGTGFFGDGKASNGNIFLGGLAADTALGGIGNDFLAGGGNGGGINGTSGTDYLSGGRNADFFFAELSNLSSTDGNNSTLVGGTTSDDTIANVGGSGGIGTQDNDWVLLEVSDDDEPFEMALSEGTGLNLASTASGIGFFHSDVESVNASGNLYGFLDDVKTLIGARASDGFGDVAVAGEANYGRGSTAQLRIIGSVVANAIIGGYDNDFIDGATGNDLLMGGDLQFLIKNQNNPNLLDAKGGLNLTANSVGLVNDGKDELIGGAGNDNIVFESDGGTVTGGADTAPTGGRSTTGADARGYAGPRASSQGDGLWLTDFSMGRLVGATNAGEATAQQDALTKLTTDVTYRVDLGNDGAINFRNYGGAAEASQDNTNYKAVTSNNGTVPRVTLTGMETVNTTGLGAVDYKANGSNTPDLAFSNQQNYFGLNSAVDLRGNGVDNVLLASSGKDMLEGRGGDDVLSGGAGDDRFVAAFGDGVDWIARPVDANGDNLWDTTGGLVVSGGLAWGQDFRPAAVATAGTTTLVVDLGTTVLNGVDTFVATFQVRIDGVDFGGSIPIATLAAAKTTAELAAIVNPVYQAISSSVTVLAVSATQLQVRAVDTTPGDGKLPVIGTTALEGFFISGQASGVGTFQASGSILGSEGTNLEDDRLVIKSYEDRAINLGVDQTKFETAQAASMVANFAATGSQLVELQGNRLFLSNVREGDTVSVTINGAVYSYTLKAGEFADQAATGLANAINRFLDVNSSSGRIVATADTLSFGDAAEAAAGVNLSGVLVQQANVLNSMTYMVISATSSRTDSAAPFGSVSTHNQSNTEVQMLGFDGRNGALFSQDPTATPVVLFQGRNSGTTTNSLLLTAKNAGGALNGMDAWLNAAGDDFINGDDLLFGGTGNDAISAGTGDDRIIMSKGVDTVDGGGNSLLPDNTVKIYQDVLQAEEGTFGTGTSFRVVLDGALYAAGAGKGTVTAIDAKGAATADVTTFSNIELVRVLENNRNSSLDLKTLSDNVAVAVSTNGLAAEGLDVLLTTNPSTTYSIDKNNNGVIAASEITTATAVLGVENITTGNANDRVTLDQTQATANNMIDLGAQQDNTELLTLREGADIVTVNHADVTNDGVVNATDVPLRPTLTLAVQGTSLSQLTATGGALGKASFTDTFKNVEIVNLLAAATSDRFNDVLNVSATGGATVNYGNAVTVGKSLGGQLAPVTTVAQLDANTLDSGGIAPAAALGSEWVTVQGINLLERVTGSAGADRVIVADDGAMQQIQVGAFALDDSPVRTKYDFTTSTTSGFIADLTDWADQGLYQFDLGAGVDTLDYSQEIGVVAVSVDTSADDTDLVFVDNPATNGRIDFAIGVERFFGGVTSSDNWIDLAAATVATTIQFSREAASNAPPNDAQEPNGNDGATTSGLTRAAEVRSTADNTVFATFVDRTGAGIVPASLWLNVQGSNLAETVTFTDNETAAAHQLRLQAGANRVDYSLLSATITANIGATNIATVVLEQVHTANGDTILQNFSTDPVANRMTIVGTTRAGDQLNVAALVNGVVNRADPLLPTTSQVDPQFHVVDLGAGQVTESLFGQYTPVGAAAGTAVNSAFVTNVVGFENASNAGDAEVVHMLGDNGRNSLAGGNAADVVFGGRGTAGDGSADVGAGNRGDNLTGNGGADLFWYKAEAESPGGSIGGGQQAAANFSNDEDNVVNSRDTITDFTVGVDNLVFVVNDGYDSIKGNGAVPANLANPLLALVPVATTFAAGDTQVDIGNNAAGAGTVTDFDNYRMDDTLAVPLSIADIVLKVNATGGADLIDASAGLSTQNLNAAADDGLEVHVVYTAATQSQAGGFDQIINFLSGEDKIDLSFLKLARYESSKTATGVDYDTNDNNLVDATEAGGAIRALGAAPVFAVNGVAPNLFLDGAIYRPIATQTLTDGNGDPSTTVFIDANGDGNYVPTDDMVVVLVGVNVPVNGDFIFNQYGGVYGG